MNWLGTIFTLVATYYTFGWYGFAVVAVSKYQSEVSKRAQRRAVSEFNASLTDRLVMEDLEPDAARTLVMGRVRFVEGVRRRFSSGVNKEHLTLIISFAGVEIDGFETFYFFDSPLTLDENGYVASAPYLKSGLASNQVFLTLSGSGTATVHLTTTPVAGSVSALQYEALDVVSELPFTLSGTTVTITGGEHGASATVIWQSGELHGTSRIRAYTGAPGQNVGAVIAYFDEVTATDRFEGIALAVVDLEFDPDVFPQGRPNVTAVMRGARMYDPRKDSTVAGRSGSHRYDDPATWEYCNGNPALQCVHYARWEGGWKLRRDEIMPMEEVAAQADICDVSTEFTLHKTGGSTEVVTLPRYSCGITVKADADAGTRRAAMDAIMATMAGSDGWDGGVWRFRAGAKAAPSFTLDESWLVTKVGKGGKAGTDTVLRGANAYGRDQRINTVSGKCIDPDQRWQLLPFPEYSDDVLVGRQGIRKDEVSYDGVAHIAQAQHLASITIREAQAGTRIEAMCGIKAYRARLLDVGTLLLPSYGMDVALSKTAEVISRTWGPRSGVKLSMAEITDEMFTPVAALKGRDPAPDSNLREPWDVEDITGVVVTSGTTTASDGSIIARAFVEWDPVVGAEIRQGGEVQIQYIQLEDGVPIPEGDWPMWPEAGTATKTMIPGLIAGQFYAFRLRVLQRQPVVRGKWSVQVVVQIAPPPDAGLYSLDAGAAAIVLSASSAGVVGSYTAATFTPQVLRSGVAATGWTISRTDGSGVTSTFTGGVVTVTAMASGTDASYIDISAARSGYATLTARVPVTKAKGGAIGANGSRTAELIMFQWAATDPTAWPAGTSTYTWATGLFTAPATPNGWTLMPGASAPGQTLYAVRQLFSDALTTATSVVTWAATSSAPAGAAGTNGTPGINGLSTFTVKLYKLASSTPTAPTGGTYNFSTATLTPPATWGPTQPANSATDTTYSVEYTFVTSTPAVDVTATTWLALTALVVPLAPFTVAISAGYSSTVNTGAPRNLGSRSLTVSGGVTPLTYQWSLEDWAWSDLSPDPEWYFPGGTSSSTASLYVVSPGATVLTGRLRCQVIDATGRIATDSKSVTANIV